MRVGFSNHALDMIATDLSKFANPNVPELVLRDDKTLQNNILESVLGVFGGEVNARLRHLMTNIVRRVFASVHSYREGRKHALEYVGGDRHRVLPPYFCALMNFETCLSNSWQIVDYQRRVAKVDAFKPGDESKWERLHAIYTYGTKHPFDRYDAETNWEMPTTLWLTNSGISCLSGESLRFQELSEIVIENNEFFYEAQKRARDKARTS